jgi:hypothetical protein
VSIASDRVAALSALLSSPLPSDVFKEVATELAILKTVEGGVQSSDDILRLRSLTPRKPAAVTLTTTTAVDLIPVPANPAHRHVICWLCGQNTTDTATVADFTGGVVPIKVVAPVKGSGIDRAADPQIMTLPAGAAFRVGQSVATTFEASCGYYTIDATGAPV